MYVCTHTHTRTHAHTYTVHVCVPVYNPTLKWIHICSLDTTMPRLYMMSISGQDGEERGRARGSNLCLQDQQQTQTASARQRQSFQDVLVRHRGRFVSVCRSLLSRARSLYCAPSLSPRVSFSCLLAPIFFLRPYYFSEPLSQTPPFFYFSVQTNAAVFLSGSESPDSTFVRSNGTA